MKGSKWWPGLLVAFFVELLPGWVGAKEVMHRAATVPTQYPAPEASDTRFVVKIGDSTCGNMGSIQRENITFYIPIDRYFGDTALLLKNKALPSSILLTMIVWDVDEAEGEVDEIFVNGKKIEGGTFYGANEIWRKNTFQIPISALNLPDAPGKTASNKISINISVGDPGHWVTQVNWASLDIPAPPPVVISHGIKDSAEGSSDLLDSETGMRDLKAAVEALGLPVHTFSYGNKGFNSIEAGAKELAREIEKVKTSNHVDKVTVLCHSMGGIKARHYTTEIDRNAESVDRVIQIATPNGGSNVTALRKLVPKKITDAVLMQLPAIRQLIPREMRAYNKEHRLNTRVKYVVLAGNGELSPLFPGDWVVSVKSAHTMVPAHAQSPVWDSKATHGGLVTAGPKGMVGIVIGDKLKNDLLEVKHSEDMRYDYGDPVLLEETEHLWSVRTGIVNLGTTSFAFPFQLSRGTDEGASVSFVADENIQISKIRSPSGHDYSPDDAGVQIDTFAGITTIRIASAEAGTWTVNATRTSGKTELPYAVAVWEDESDLLLGGGFVAESVRVGSSFVLEMTPTKAGAALTGLSGSAIVTFPDGLEQSNAFTNVKTGHYRATFKATQAGTYLVTAKMTISGVEYVRMFTCTAYGSATKFGTLTAIGPADDDGDGFYDRLSVSGTLSGAASSTSYRVFALLADQNGTNITWAAATVTNGASTFRLDFDGTAIHEHGPATKYVVSTLRLSEQGEEYAAEIDSRDGAVVFQGMSWAWNHFAHPLLRIPGTGTESIVSASTTNSASALEVYLDVAIDASVAGTYDYSVSLKTADGTLVGTSYGTKTLTASSGIVTNCLVLRFPCSSIANTGIDGPYFVTDLLLWNEKHDFAPMGTYETHPWTASDFIWNCRIRNGEAVVTGISEAVGSVAIPATLGGCPVTCIGYKAFAFCTRLTSVTIPDSVTIIGDAAFRECRGLTSLIIGNSVTRIGDSAFCLCSSLRNVTIPDSVTSIGDFAFDNCSGLTNLTINSVTSFGDYVFRECSGLTSLTIGNRVTLIGYAAFYNCSSLRNVTIPDSVTTIGDDAFRECSGLTSLTIGNSVTSIGGRAFFYCDSLTSVTIPDSVTSIGSRAFSGCRGLFYDTHTFPGVCLVDGWAVGWTNSLSGDLDLTGVRGIAGGAFMDCRGLKSVTIPDSVTSIGDAAFSGCTGLTSVTIPDSVTSIGYAAFDDCSSLRNVTIPDSVTSIEDCVFSGCTGLTSVTIPDSVTSIGGRVFYECSGLTSLTIGNSVTSIGDFAFDNCSGLASMTIPDSVTNIGLAVFSKCNSLKTLYVPATWQGKTASAFSSYGSLQWLGFPNKPWNDYAEVPEGCMVVYTSLELGASNRSFTAAATSGQTLAVTANISWTAKTSASWLTLATAGGSGNGTIAYGVAANAATTTRTGTITVAGGGLTRTFTVMQGGAAATLALGTSSQSFTAAAASGQKLTVTANVPWTAKSSSSWLTVAATNGNGNGTISYSVAANAATNSRTGTITVAGGGLTRTFKVAQSGAAAALTLGASSQGFTAAAASGQKLAVTGNVPWTAKSSATWLTVATTNGSGNGTISYSVAANASTNSRTGTITVTGEGMTKTFKVTQNGAAAALALGASSQSFTAAAASGQKLAVTANVPWTAKSSASWLTMATTNGSGNGTISYSVAANAATNSRTGTITVAGGGLTRTFKVTQSGAAAALTLGASSQGFTAAAASGQKLTVTGNVAWTAKSSASWLTVATTNGSGNGTISYSVAANTATNSRTGTISVAGGGLTRTFKVTQSGAAAALTLGASSQGFTAAAASGQKLTVTGNVAWTAKSSATWLTVATTNGSGNGTISYSVAANAATNSRTGSITVAGGGLTRTFKVTQSGAAATLELAGSERTFTAAAASGKLLGVTANVPWTAKSSSSWLTVKTASGSGNGNIEYAVTANTGATRTGTITVSGGGLTRTFTVTQEGKTATLELGASERTFSADAASGKLLGVTANVSWTAKSSASWLTVKTASGSGNGNIEYAVSANTGAARTGTITVTGGGVTRTFTVTQNGVAAKLELGTTGQGFTADAAGGQKLTVTANVAWTATSGAEWLTVTAGSGTGNGSIAYNVAANTGTEERTGAISVTGGGLTRLFLVTQSGAAAVLELAATSKNFAANAISGQKLGVTANVAWTATSSVSWLTVTTGSGMGNGTITYTVAANTGTGERMGAITVTGGGLTRIFLAMQAGKAETQEPVAVPRAWLEANAAALLAANGGDCEAAAQAEAANGMAVWECYVAGLSVTNAAEEFKVLSVEIVDGVPQVEWNPDLNEKGTKTERTYRLWGKQKLDDSEWTDVTDVPDLDAEGWRYFRVGVRMPEQ